MKELWHTLYDVKISDDRIVHTSAVADADSPWFPGHFPGDPILPGIAQLGIVHDLLLQHPGLTGNKGSLARMKKIRFRRIIRPGEKMHIIISHASKNEFSFKISVADEQAASGILVISDDF
jgi:3-hydroxymyristoyl/3-hydroxydecanoyl-(acyl carrier protein) dehydratase